MNIPQHIRDEVRDRLWSEADRLNWPALSSTDKSRYYTIWTETQDLGGRLATFMDPRQVRVYIKDTLLKSYAREALADPIRPYRVLGIPIDAPVREVFIKPHGRLLMDDRQIAWSRASEWKATLMALHERSFARGTPYGAVLYEAGARFGTDQDRSVVVDAARKLGIERVIWLE